MSVTIERTHAFDEARKAGREPFKVKDLSLAEFGRKEIRLAEQEMPGLMAVRQRYSAKKPLAGMQIMGSLHMTIQRLSSSKRLPNWEPMCAGCRATFSRPRITRQQQSSSAALKGEALQQIPAVSRCL